MSAEVWRSQNSFSGGVVSEKIYGRVELQQYQDSLSELLNFKIMPHGGVTRRSGTRIAGEVKSSSSEVRNIPFEVSADLSYMIEAGPQYFRFVQEGVQVTSGGSPVEIVTPYLEAELFELRFVQSADVMWIVHKNHAPRKLYHYASDEWYMEQVIFIDGPYLPVNASAITLIAGAATGLGVSLTAAGGVSITGTADGYNSQWTKITTDIPHGLQSGEVVTISGVVGTTEVNGTWSVWVREGDPFVFEVEVVYVNAYVSGGSLVPSLFAATDVGRLVRIFNTGDAKWAWGQIVGYTNAYTVTVDIIENNFPITSTDKWRLGKYSETTGWPAVVMLHETRLAFAGADIALQDIDLSQTDRFDWFQVAADENLLATDALSWSLYSESVDGICWLKSARGGLGVGTSGSVGVMTGAGGPDDPMTPSSIGAKIHSAIGSHITLVPVKIDNAVIFVDKAGQRVHEFAYMWQDNSYESPDLSILADHLFAETEIIDLDVQRTKKIIWFVTADGRLCGLTYMRKENVVAWHEHTTDGKFESVCCITEGKKETVYFIVRRLVGGAYKRFIEYMDVDWISSDIAECNFLDSSVVVNDKIDITAATQANPVQVTAVGHGLITSDQIQIDDVDGMEDLNGNRYTVTKISDDIIELDGTDGTAFNAYVEGGYLRKVFTTVSGLDHLEGETVYGLIDGKVTPNLVVSGGDVTLSSGAVVAAVGINFFSDGETLPIEMAADNRGSTVGRMKDLGRIAMRVSKSYGCLLGRDFDNMDQVTFNENVTFGAKPVLFSGEKGIDKVEGSPSTDVRVCFRQSVPLPLTINSINVKLLVLED